MLFRSGRSKGRRNTRDDIAQQIATINGVSMRTARREIMPFLATMTHHCKNRELTVAMAAQYELSAEHVAFVTGSGKDTNKVQSIVEDAERLREEAAVEGSEGAFEGASAGETDAADGDETESGEDQATLAGDSTGDERSEGTATADEDQPEDTADDQQSGLSDFM